MLIYLIKVIQSYNAVKEKNNSLFRSIFAISGMRELSIHFLRHLVMS